MIRRGARVVVTTRYDGQCGRAFVGDRATITPASKMGQMSPPDFGYEEEYWVRMDRGFEMFIPEGCLRPLRPLELLAECAE